jgi:hypothetical protein
MKKWAIIPLMLLVAGLVSYQLIMSSQGEAKLPVMLVTTTADCDPLNIPCKAGDAQHAVTLHFPEEVAYLKPFKIRVTIQGFGQEVIEKVEVDFKMMGMDMGLNRFTLSPSVNEKGNVTYEGEGILPVCVSGRVDWLASTHVMTTDKIYEAVFGFKVTK